MVVVPKPVALLGFGRKTFPDVESVVANAETNFGVWDLNQLLSDPMSNARVEHKQDGSHAKTAIAVLSNSQFAPTCTDIITSIFEKFYDTEGIIIGVKCNTSFHRTDVMLRILVDALNRVTDQRGDRLFNAQMFNVCAAKDNSEAHFMAKNAANWSKEAWASPEQMPTAKYAEAWSRQTPLSAKSFEAVWRYFPWGAEYLTEHIPKDATDGVKLTENGIHLESDDEEPSPPRSSKRPRIGHALDTVTIDYRRH